MDARVENSILILEDEPIIALDLEDMIKEIGFERVTTLVGEDANVWLETNTPALAIIDVQSKNGPRVEVAETLAKRSIPFVVCSGVNRLDVHNAFRKGMWVPKPCNAKQLVEAIYRFAPEIRAPLVHG